MKCRGKKDCVKLANVGWQDDMVTKVKQPQKALYKSPNKFRLWFNDHENFSVAISSREAQTHDLDGTRLTFSCEWNLWESFMRAHTNSANWIIKHC